jgi:hypothetical protein
VTIVELARCFLHVREAGPNAGLRVQAIQTWSGGQKGDSYCMELAWMWLDLYFRGKSPVTERIQACEDFHALAHLKGWIVPNDQRWPGDFYLFVNAEGHAHHVGLVTTWTDGIAGNTSPDGRSSDGSGCFEHAVPFDADHVVIVRVPGVQSAGVQHA